MFLNMLFGLQKFALMFCCISSLLVCVHLFNVSDVLKGLHVLTMIRLCKMYVKDSFLYTVANN